MSTLANFTKTLIISFSFTLIYLFLPSDFVVMGQLIKYGILVSIIITLMSYKNVIEKVEPNISNLNSSEKAESGSNEIRGIFDENNSTKDLL